MGYSPRKGKESDAAEWLTHTVCRHINHQCFLPLCSHRQYTDGLSTCSTFPPTLAMTGLLSFSRSDGGRGAAIVLPCISPCSL